MERDKWDKIPPPFDRIELRRLVWISFWPGKLRNCYSIQDNKKNFDSFFMYAKKMFICYHVSCPNNMYPLRVAVGVKGVYCS